MKYVNAIARYIPLVGWVAQIESKKELDLWNIKNPPDNLKNGKAIKGMKLNNQFTLMKIHHVFDYNYLPLGSLCGASADIYQLTTEKKEVTCNRCKKMI